MVRGAEQMLEALTITQNASHQPPSPNSVSVVETSAPICRVGMGWPGVDKSPPSRWAVQSIWDSYQRGCGVGVCDAVCMYISSSVPMAQVCLLHSFMPVCSAGLPHQESVEWSMVWLTVGYKRADDLHHFEC